MARRVFFSFHYKRDIGRIGQIRNSWVVRSPIETAGFVDSAEWESIERQGDPAIQRWINSQLHGTSVTVVLIGAETYKRRWVKYEIEKTHNDGKGLLGIKVHNVKDFRTQATDVAGLNPLDQIKTSGGSLFSQLYPTYDWAINNGRENIEQWIEKAIQDAQQKKSSYNRF